LAEEVSVMVHGRENYAAAVDVSQILFGNATSDALKKLDEQTFLSLFEGVPIFDITNNDLPQNIVELLAVKTAVFPSKGECRKMIQGGGVLLNKEKVNDTDLIITTAELINNKYLLIQKGKKNYFIIRMK
jgi:tyrosyl-tRNA synthetase